MQSMSDRTTIYKSLVILIVAFSVFICFMPALDFGFVWDDANYLLIESIQKNPNLIEKALTEPFLVSSNYYRPLATLSIYLEAYYTNADPFHMHLTNLIIHILNSIMVTIISGILVTKFKSHNINKYVVMLFGGIFYGTHPTVIESAVWVSGRFDLLLTFFILCGILSDLVIKNSNIRSASIGFFFFLAALCKEMALGFALMLPFWHYFLSFGERKLELSQSFRNQFQVKSYFYIIVFGFLYLIIRSYFLGYVMQITTGGVVKYANNLEHFYLILKTIWLYFQSILVPFIHLSPTHSASYPILFADKHVLKGLTLLVVTLACGVFSARLRLIALAVAVLLAALFPVLNIIPMTIKENIIHERFILFPLAIMIFSFIVIFLKFSRGMSHNFKYFIAVTASIFIAVNTLNVIVTLPLWKNNYSLWSWAIASDPKSDTAKINFAISLSNYGASKQALKIIDQQILKSPASELFVFKGTCHANLGELEKAESAYMKSLDYKFSRKEQYADLLTKLASVQLRQAKFKDIKYLLDRSLSFNPYAHETYFRYSLYLSELGDYAAALKMIQQAIKYSPADEQSKYYDSIKESFLAHKKLSIVEPVSTEKSP